ncbi:MAG TPA: phenylalanine--tRNA ligase subunit alpha [candidate division Zixibacteria bacterium]|nr:phenylalanine--tRNA ligase subunit alpha [candidate division Zixibacteria bacterium]
MSPTDTLTKDQSTILKIIEIEKEISQKDLVKKTKFDQVKVAKIVLELSEKSLVDSIEKTEKDFFLTKEGKSYLKIGLPEKQVFSALTKFKGKVLLDDFKEKSGLNQMLVNIAVGWLRRKDWVEFTKEGKKTFIEAKEMTEDIDENVLQLISKSEIQPVISNTEIQESIENLKKRKILEIQEKRTRIVKLSPEGIKAINQGIKVLDKLETTLTPKMIITGAWRKKEFKSYDPSESVPVTHLGRKHPVIEVINELREIFLEMGFTEIRGPIVESEFWNFDALFQPQDHPARELADTFKLSHPAKANLPPKELVENVAKTHENGWKTGSTGWKYKWLLTEAERVVLRTHTTATTCRHLSKAFKEWTPPEKVFSIDRVYRNESVDFTHLAEFMQFEGIIVDKNVTLRNLMGSLKTFYGKMGFKKVRLIPSFYPYTEPSMSTLIYVDKFNSWLEMGGSGIFRPEVTLPFGVKEKVLAWGQGLDRLVMLKLDLDDIREVYSTNINRLRNTPVIF